MKYILIALSLTAATSTFAFSVSAREYSRHALGLVVNDQAVLNVLPAGESITSIEQVSSRPYRFEVKAGKCTLEVELSTATPQNFIGNGFPHDPKVVDSTGCQQ